MDRNGGESINGKGGQVIKHFKSFAVGCQHVDVGMDDQLHDHDLCYLILISLYARLTSHAASSSVLVDLISFSSPFLILS